MSEKLWLQYYYLSLLTFFVLLRQPPSLSSSICSFLFPRVFLFVASDGPETMGGRRVASRQLLEVAGKLTAGVG
jgi:hypothetical protein